MGFIAIGVISAGYCGISFRFCMWGSSFFPSVLTLRSFVRRRAEFNQIMSSNRSLTMGRWHLRQQKSFSQHPKTWTNSTATPVGPWRSWADTHFAFSRVEQISAVVRHENYLVALAFEFSRWVVVFCALVFFAFLGFAEEARKNYQKSLRFLTKSCRYRGPYTPSPVMSIDRSKAKPVYMLLGAPSLPVYSSSLPSSLSSHHTKRSKSSIGSLITIVDTSSQLSGSHSPRDFPIILHAFRVIESSSTT